MRTFDWRPGIGDPTPMGWLTVGLYLLAAYLSWRLAGNQAFARTTGGREQPMWLGLTFLLLALGINKQLDLQSALTELGRVISSRQGWYDHRAAVQLAFVVAVGLAGVAAAAGLALLARRVSPATRLALVGVSLLISFVAIRAASFHHVDVFISLRLLGLRWNWILEIGGIAVIILAALQGRQQERGRRAHEG